MSKKKKRKPTGDERNRVRNLLEELKRERSQEVVPDFFSVLHEPSGIPRKIPLLAEGMYRSVTPMLKERFLFVGRWENAFPATTWLGIEDMEGIWSDPEIKERVEIRREFWEGSAPAEYEDRELSLFAIEPELDGDIYLVWPPSHKEEPAVYWYVAQHFHQFANLCEYLEYIVGYSNT